MEPKAKVKQINENVERLMAAIATDEARDARLDEPAPHSAHAMLVRAIQVADREIMRLQEFRHMGVPCIEKAANRKIKQMNRALHRIEVSLGVFIDTFKR